MAAPLFLPRRPAASQPQNGPLQISPRFAGLIAGGWIGGDYVDTSLGPATLTPTAQFSAIASASVIDEGRTLSANSATDTGGIASLTINKAPTKNNFTFVGVFRVRGTSGVGVGARANTDNILLWRNSGNYNVRVNNATTAGGAMPLNTTLRYVLTSTPSGIWLSVNGVEILAAAASASSADMGVPLELFEDSRGGGAMDMDVALCVLLNAGLAREDARQLSANPWQMIAAPQRILPMSAAGAFATASPAGVSATAATGTASGSGAAAAGPNGIAASALVGTATASSSASANASPVGVAATAAVGSTTPAGGASLTAVGVSASANIGTATADGSSTATPAGVSAACAVGTATASSTGAGTAAPAGVVASASTGAPTASAAANVTATGVSASGIVAGAGQVSAATSSDGQAAPGGVAANAQAGSAAATAGANVVPIGVSATATLGQAIATGGVVVNASALPGGVVAYGLIGNASAVEMAALQPNPAQTYTGMTRTRAYAGNTRVRQL